MRTLLLSFAIVGVLCGCSSKSDYGEARGIVCDATMNTVTIVTDDNDTLSFSTVDTDKSGSTDCCWAIRPRLLTGEGMKREWGL